MVEALAKEMPHTIATKNEKGAKKTSASRSFADFVKDLGKTTEHKNVESNILNSNNILTKSSKNNHLNAINEVKKTEILSNLLKGKTQEVKNEKNIQSPLDSILQRPKATHTKLNATPEIKQPKEFSEPQSERFSNRDAVLRSLKGTHISFADSPQDSPKIIKTAETSIETADKMIPSMSDLENTEQNMIKNKAEIADFTLKDSDAKSPQDSAKNLQKNSLSKNTQDSHPQSQNVSVNQQQNPQDLQKLQPANIKQNLTQSSMVVNDTPKTTQENNILNESQDTQDSQYKYTNNPTTDIINHVKSNEKLPNITQLQKDLLQTAPNTANQSTQNTQDPILNQTLNTTNLVQDPQETAPNVTKEQTADKTQNFAKLGIANTLKYGAFKAFDALSLLKPSDGKKLSELIKKADELSLNLQSVKYTKMAQTPLSSNYFAQNLTPKIEPKAENKLNSNTPNLTQNVTNNTNQIIQNQSQTNIAQNDSIIAQVLNESVKPNETQKSQNLAQNETATTKNDNSQILKNDKHNDPQNNGKNLAQNNTKDAPQNTSKTLEMQENKSTDIKMPEPKLSEPKIAESKIEQSPKNDTSTNTIQTPNSDLKPASFKISTNEQKKINSKGESNANQNITQINNEQFTQSQNNITNVESNQKVEQLGAKLFDSRETMRHFAYNLRTEIQNYKPPLTRITLELQPANLGNVEVSIISQGKNIQIQLHAPQNTLNLFIQNQSDLRTALSQIGYENVAMSFSNGSQMGFSDNSGKWRYESNANKFRNNFGLKELDDKQDESEVFEIMITNNYA